MTRLPEDHLPDGDLFKDIGPPPRGLSADLEKLLNDFIDDAPTTDRRKVRSLMRSNEEFAQNVRATQRIGIELSRPVDAPDLSAPILNAVDAKRAFLTRVGRRRVSAARVGIACSLLCCVAAVAILQRMYPRELDVQGSPRPVGAVAEAVRADAGEGVRNLVGAIESMGAEVVAPMATLVQAPRGAPSRGMPRMGLGDTSAYDPATSSIGAAALASAETHWREPRAGASSPIETSLTAPLPVAAVRPALGPQDPPPTLARRMDFGWLFGMPLPVAAKRGPVDGAAPGAPGPVAKDAP